jgi:hypothetical protein
MRAYVFVYSPSKFKVGEHALKRFEHGQQHDHAPTAIEAGAEGVVGRGIYAIESDAVDLRPEIHPAESTSTNDYDLLIQPSLLGKDPWPTLVDSEPNAPGDRAMGERVRAAFPALRDKHLQQHFLEPRGV